MTRHTVARALAAAAALALLGACGDAPSYDPESVESFLQSNQADTFGPRAMIGDATCPPHRSLREGMSLRCRLDVSGTAVPYRVRLTHVHAKKVRIQAHVDGVVIATNAIRSYVRSTLPKASAAALVDCGHERFVVAEVGQTLHCSMTLGPQRKTLRITVKDLRGTVDVAS